MASVCANPPVVGVEGVGVEGVGVEPRVIASTRVVVVTSIVVLRFVVSASLPRDGSRNVDPEHEACMNAAPGS
jgi:hypothetical protein